jgi:ribosomal protein S18 acetylase RimI-like enzyme
MLIRPATPADLPALAAVEREAFADEAYPPFFFRQAHDLWPGLLRVAEAPPGRAVGYVLAAVGGRPGEAWVLSAAVRASHRGRGLGAALMEDVQAVLAARGVRAVRLTVHPGNAGAVRLYRRLGYEVEREEADYFGPGERRLVMRRALGAGPPTP